MVGNSTTRWIRRLGYRNPTNLLAPPKSVDIGRVKSALIVVDMQYLDAHPDHGVGRAVKRKRLDPLYAAYWRRITAITPKIRRLQEACRDHGIEVMHTRIASLTQDCRDISWGHHIRRLLAPMGSVEARFLEAVAPRGDEVVISKTSSSPFTSTPIDQVLRNMEISLLIVCGVTTNACVEMTVRDAADRNYAVIVVRDACAALTDELHRAALLLMDGFMGLVHIWTTAEVLRSLKRIPKRARAR